MLIILGMFLVQYPINVSTISVLPASAYDVPFLVKFICRLQRGLYGLKQATGVWNGTGGGDWIYVPLHVDDMLVAAKEEQ